MIFAIAAGGALGAVSRYYIYGTSLRALGDGFPYGTMMVNIIGSLAMGILIALFDSYWQPSPQVKMFLMTGFLGALTTFSNFSMDAVLMFEKGDVIQSSFYVAGSVFFSVFALFTGMLIVRQFSL